MRRCHRVFGLARRCRHVQRLGLPRRVCRRAWPRHCVSRTRTASIAFTGAGGLVIIYLDARGLSSPPRAPAASPSPPGLWAASPLHTADSLHARAVSPSHTRTRAAYHHLRVCERPRHRIRLIHYTRMRPRYHILGRARLVIASADTSSLAITSWFVGVLVIAYG